MRLFRRLAHWWQFRAHDAELQEELSFHRDAIERDLIARGQSAAEARAAARRAMGNETFMREDSRAVWLWPSIEALWQDARATLRGLRKSPAFTAGVLLTFALGVGANAAMFSLIDRLMFRPPAFMRDPSSVHCVYLYRTSDGIERGTGGQYVRNVDLARFSTAFSDVGRHTLRLLAVGTGQNARELRVGVVSASFFGFFDAPPVIGRYFSADEDAEPEGAPVAVLAYYFWQLQYGGRRDAIGSTLHIGLIVYTIIGIAPEDFVGLWPLRPPVAFIPVTTYAATDDGPNWATNYGHSFNLSTIVRRRPGVSMAAASADLTNALRRSYLTETAGDAGRDRVAELRPRAVAGSILTERGPEASRESRVATWLAGVTLIVLLIACANVASLLLTRALARRREIALRVALGVSRARLLSQLVTESMVLAIGGSALGLGVAVWLSALLADSFLPGSARAPVATDARTIGFIAIVALACGLFTSVFPMLQARKLSLTNDLKSSARAGTYQRSGTRVGLLIMQGALSLVLLVGAGLFVKSLRNLRAVPLGFDGEPVLVVETEMRGVQLDSAPMYLLRRRLLAAATTVPGAAHATLQAAVPFYGMSSSPIFVMGIDSLHEIRRIERNAVSSDYFATMGTRILRGRGIEPGDVDGARRVMVVGAALAARLWPGDDPLGKCVRIASKTMPCTYVVGIAEDIHTESFAPEARTLYYYVPAAQFQPQMGGLFVRARGDARLLTEPLRRRLQQEMPGALYVTSRALRAARASHAPCGTRTRR